MVQTIDCRAPCLTANPNPIDKSQELVEWYECYAKMEDDDGGATLHRSVCQRSVYSRRC
jgi:hypothetical protein